MDWNIAWFIQKPLFQAGLFLLLTLLIILIIQPKTADSAWHISVIIFALFLVVNAGLLWLDNSPWRYFFYSIGFALAYVLAISILMSIILKILSLEGSGEGAMAFLIIIYQPFALLLVMLAKWLVYKWFRSPY